MFPSHYPPPPPIFSLFSLFISKWSFSMNSARVFSLRSCVLCRSVGCLRGHFDMMMMMVVVYTFDNLVDILLFWWWWWCFVTKIEESSRGCNNRSGVNLICLNESNVCVCVCIKRYGRIHLMILPFFIYIFYIIWLFIIEYCCFF